MNIRTSFLPLLAALTFATPAQADEQTPLDRFTWARVVTVCLVQEGHSTIKETVEEEIEWLVENGMTYEQYKNFNAASDQDEWLGKRVQDVIAEEGGCPGVMSITDKPEHAPKPVTSPAYLY